MNDGQDLTKKQIPFTVFISTDFLDNQKLMHRNLISICISKYLELDEEKRQSTTITLSGISGRRFRSDRAVSYWLSHLQHEDASLVSAAAEVLEIDTKAYLEEHRPYLSSEEVKELSSAGITIGAHSLSHPRFRLIGQPEIIEREMDITMALCGERLLTNMGRHNLI